MWEIILSTGAGLGGAILGANVTARNQRQRDADSQLLSLRSKQFEACRTLALDLRASFRKLEYPDLPDPTITDSEIIPTLAHDINEHVLFASNISDLIKTAQLSEIDDSIGRFLDAMASISADVRIALMEDDEGSQEREISTKIHARIVRAHGLALHSVGVAESMVGEARNLVKPPAAPESLAKRFRNRIDWVLDQTHGGA
jgi:hypothetical protein